LLKNTFSKKFKFKNWPKKNFPTVAAGVYAIWDDQTLLYVGTAGKDLDKAKKSGKNKFGLITRLNSHASGRTAGDQFCSLLSNRIVIPSLTKTQIIKFKEGSVTLDQITKKYIRCNLEYQYLVVDNFQDAIDLEMHSRRGAIFSTTPLLNPGI
tara:strand:- start:199 stop:657 length:459 start_codon:yes stop_codon:yes gene_type:complete